MEQNISFKGEKYLKNRKKWKRWQKVVTAMACVVVFCTTYALILPAITLTDANRKLDCPLSVHEHVKSCYDADKNLICGEADFVVHSHEKGCFDADGKLVCTLPEVEAHEHTAKCYREESVLACTLEEQDGHQHSDACYKTEQGDLICTETAEDHEHSAACYAEKKVLTCGKESDEGSHAHSKGCYEVSEVLTCKETAVLHKHTDKCYGSKKHLICGEMQVLEHVHGNGCFTEAEGAAVSEEEAEQSAVEEVPAGESVSESEQITDDSLNGVPYSGTHNAEAYLVPAAEKQAAPQRMMKARAMTLADTEDITPYVAGDKYDLTNYITTVNIQRRENDGQVWENLTNNNVKVGDQLRFDINYELPEGTLDASHRTITYHVPDNFTIVKADSGDVLDGQNKKVGTYVISEDGSVTITFDEDYAEKNAGGAKINGHIAFESSVEALNGEEGGEITIPFKDGTSYTIHVKAPGGDLGVEKVSKNVAPFDGKLDYEITVTSAGGTGDVVVLEDTMEKVIPNIPNGQTIADVISIKDKDGKTVSVSSGNISYNPATGKLNITLPQMGPDSQYVISYPAIVSDNGKTGTDAIPSDFGSALNAKNHVSVTSTDSLGKPLTDEDEVENVFNNGVVSKNGVLDGNTIHWTITLNHIANRFDISGWTLSDELNGEDYNGTVTITPNPNTGAGTLTVNLPYTFPDNTPVGEYTVTYDTPGDASTTNKGILTPPYGTGMDSGIIGAGTFQVDKKPGSQYTNGVVPTGEYVDGKPVYKMDWTVTLDTTQGAVPVTTGRHNVAGNADYPAPDKYWLLRDSFPDGYFTPQQIQEAAANICAAISESGYQGNYYIFAGRSNTDGVLVWQSDDHYPSNVVAGNGKYSLDDGKQRNMIAVYFDEAFPAGKTIEWNYSTSAVISDMNSAILFGNTVTVQSKIQALKWAGQSYQPVVTKKDARTNKTGNSMYEYASSGLDYSDGRVKQKNVLRWTITTVLPADREYTEDVVITETLPEGTELLPLQNANGLTGRYSLSASFGDGVGGTSLGAQNVFVGDNIYLQSGKNWTYQHWTNDGPIEGTGNSTGDACTITYDGYTVTFKRISETEYQIILPPDLANRVKGGYGTIEIAARIKDGYDFGGLQHDFTNNVTITTGDTTLGNAAQTQIVKKTIIGKNSDGAQTGKKDGVEYTYIPYYLVVNPSGANLVPNSNTLTVTDVLSFKQPANGNVNLMLDYDSIQVYEVAEDQLDKLTMKMGMANVTDLKNKGCLTDITNQCTYSAQESVAADGTNSSTLTLTVPDSKPLIILYSYKTSGSAAVDLRNTATVEGQGGTSDSDEHHMDVQIQESNASAVLVGVNVYKVDSKNYAVHLNGAEFKLEKWNGTGWVEVNSFTTGNQLDNGVVVNQGFFNTGKLDDNTAYRLTETKAPQGYEMKTPTVYEFYIKNTAMGAAPECKPDGFNGKLLNNGDNINISNVIQEYELPHTGGMGTNTFCMAGGLLMMVSGAALTVLRRKEN